MCFLVIRTEEPELANFAAFPLDLRETDFLQELDTHISNLQQDAAERAIEAAIVDTTPMPLRTLYNPDTCPVELLPHLASSWSVDRWDEKWSEPVKRNAVKASFYVHAHKGTIGALRRVVEPLGCDRSWRT
ncbi:Tail protein I [Pseudomonas savastanoi]|uniref:Tail protein I n=1 Tax=Pseudomonas savastanoi TaxID=29438 RepID=A0A3M5GB96_PSESS|nr:Tail protein I [Pseudomonas savastanoi]